MIDSRSTFLRGPRQKVDKAVKTKAKCFSLEVRFKKSCPQIFEKVQGTPTYQNFGDPWHPVVSYMTMGNRGSVFI